jgi:FdrA protein
MTKMIEVNVDLLSKPLVIINVGLYSFGQNIINQGVEMIHVEWKPPAGGDKEMIALLDKLLG